MINKIAVISQEYPPKTGGAGVYAKNLIELLSDAFYTEAIVGQVAGNVLFASPKFYVAPIVRKLGFVGLYLMYFLRTKIFRQSYDKIILNDVGAAWMAGIFFSKKECEKCICVIHGSEPENIYDGNRPLYRFLNIKNVYSNLLKNACSVWFVSDDMREKMKSRTGNIFKNSQVVYNFIDNDLFITKDQKEPLHKFTFLTISRIVKQKGFDRMFRVLLKMKRKGYLFCWKIIGDGDYLKDFQNIVNNSEMFDDITFLGYIEQKCLPTYIECADLMFLLSEYRESFGRIYIEGAAMGCPGFGYNYGGVSEAIADGVSGVLVKKDATDEVIVATLEKIFTKEITFDRRAVIEIAERFSKNAVKNKMIALVNEP